MQKEKIQTFTQLNAWMTSHKLVLKVFKEFEKTSKVNSLRSQIERSAVSITSNIAEGFGRQSQLDKKHFYIMARGSAYELQNQLLIARDINLISTDTFKEIAKLSVDSTKLLHGLIRSLDRKANS